MSDQGSNDQQGGLEPQMTSPGAQLAAYRKERGWTVEQVASQLNLAPRQIVAIESDDYPSLPGMPIVRGFVRAYAKLLKVDAAPLLASLGGETVLVHEPIQPRKTLATPFSEARIPSMTERQGLSSKWVVGALVILLVGVAIWAVRYEQSAEPSKSSAPQANPSSTPAQVPAIPDAGREPPSAASGQAGAEASQPAEPAPPTADVANQAAAAGANAPVAAPSTAPAVPAAPAVSEPPAPQPEAAKDVLTVNAREDSWVEIRRADNNAVLLSRIVKAGETEKFEMNQPVSVVIGNAAGVDLALRGAPMELKRKTNSNVARLNLK